MTKKRYSHDAIVIVDHLKQDLIYIDGKDELLELAEHVDKLQEENDFLEIENESLEDGATKYAELYHKSLKEIEQLNKKLHIYKSDGLETLNDLQRCYENAKKATKTIDALYEENEQLKQDGLYWAETAEARRKEIDKLQKDNSILKQQRDYLFDVIDDVLPHSGSTTVYNIMKDIGDVE